MLMICGASLSIETAYCSPSGRLLKLSVGEKYACKRKRSLAGSIKSYSTCGALPDGCCSFAVTGKGVSALPVLHGISVPAG